MIQIGEKQLDSAIRELCAYLGVARYHAFDSRRSRPGFPDLVLWKHRVMFRELKSEKGRLSRPQFLVLAELRAAGQDCDVWRPADWLSGRIEAELRAL